MDRKYNNILIEFNFLIDLDLAIFKFIKAKYNNADFVNQNIIRMTDEKEILKMMINRQPINPLELLIPHVNTTYLFNDLIDNHLEELLEYAKACDIFGLMITFLREASSLTVTVLCDNQLQSDFIKSLNNNLNTIIQPNHKNIILDDYTILYVKYFPYVLKYNKINGKHIYIANARYNMEPDSNTPTIAISGFVGDTNIIHTIDLYRNITLERIKKNE